MGGVGHAGNWQSDLERWLTPFAAALRHKTRARMFATMADDPDFEYIMIDATIVRAHQHAVDKKGGLKLVRSAAHAAV